MAPRKRKAEPSPSASSSAESSESDEPEQPGPSMAEQGGKLVNKKRMRPLKEGPVGLGPVIYWMSRDQRMADNWALLHAAEVAVEKGTSVAVAFNLVPEFLGAGARHFGFMLRGLRELEQALKKGGIPFFLLQGNPAETIPKLVRDSGAGLLVTDYSPLRLGRQWRQQVGGKGRVQMPASEEPEGMGPFESSWHLLMSISPVWCRL
jgi:deoxyribodipyrimidine photo-lyase